MGTALVRFETALIMVGLFGLLALAVHIATSYLNLPPTASTPPPALSKPSRPEAPATSVEPETAAGDAESPPLVMQASIELAPREITRLRIDRIRLDTEVVPAKFVDKDGGTWDVPAFKAGHADSQRGRGSAVTRYSSATSRV